MIADLSSLFTILIKPVFAKWNLAGAEEWSRGAGCELLFEYRTFIGF